MTYIDYASSKGEADVLLEQYASKIRQLSATHIAGVSVVKYATGRWAIDLEVYIDRKSDEYRLFAARFGA